METRQVDMSQRDFIRVRGLPLKGKAKYSDGKRITDVVCTLKEQTACYVSVFAPEGKQMFVFYFN